jgi:hypothetical protein
MHEKGVPAGIAEGVPSILDSDATRARRAGGTAVMHRMRSPCGWRGRAVYVGTYICTSGKLRFGGFRGNSSSFPCIRRARLRHCCVFTARRGGRLKGLVLHITSSWSIERDHLCIERATHLSFGAFTSSGWILFLQKRASQPVSTSSSPPWPRCSGF